MTTIKSTKDGGSAGRADQLRLQIRENHDILMTRPLPMVLSTAMRAEVYVAHLDLHKILDMQGQLHTIFITHPDLAGRYFRAQKFHRTTEVYYNELYLILSKLVDEQKVGRRPYISAEEILGTPLEDRLLSDVLALKADERGDSLARLYVQPPFQPSVEELNKVLKAEASTVRSQIVIKRENQMEDVVYEAAQREGSEHFPGDATEQDAEKRERR